MEETSFLNSEEFDIGKFLLETFETDADGILNYEHNNNHGNHSNVPQETKLLSTSSCGDISKYSNEPTTKWAATANSAQQGQQFVHNITAQNEQQAQQLILEQHLLQQLIQQTQQSAQNNGLAFQQFFPSQRQLEHQQPPNENKDLSSGRPPRPFPFSSSPTPDPGPSPSPSRPGLSACPVFHSVCPSPCLESDFSCAPSRPVPSKYSPSPFASAASLNDYQQSSSLCCDTGSSSSSPASSQSSRASRSSPSNNQTDLNGASPSPSNFSLSFTATVNVPITITHAAQPLLNVPLALPLPPTPPQPQPQPQLNQLSPIPIQKALNLASTVISKTSTTTTLPRDEEEMDYCIDAFVGEPLPSFLEERPSKRMKGITETSTGEKEDTLKGNSIRLSRKQMLEMSSEEYEDLVRKMRFSRPLTEEEEELHKEQKKLIKNREAAQNSRAKKKTTIEVLRRKIGVMQMENFKVEMEVKQKESENQVMKTEIGFLMQMIQSSDVLKSSFGAFDEWLKAKIKENEEAQKLQLQIQMERENQKKEKPRRKRKKDATTDSTTATASSHKPVTADVILSSSSPPVEKFIGASLSNQQQPINSDPTQLNTTSSLYLLVLLFLFQTQFKARQSTSACGTSASSTASTSAPGSLRNLLPFDPSAVCPREGENAFSSLLPILESLTRDSSPSPQSSSPSIASEGTSSILHQLQVLLNTTSTPLPGSLAASCGTTSASAASPTFDTKNSTNKLSGSFVSEFLKLICLACCQGDGCRKACCQQQTL